MCDSSLTSRIKKKIMIPPALELEEKDKKMSDEKN